jgi:hypothetical protein
MRRREFLSSLAGLAGAAATAGCVGDAVDPGGPVTDVRFAEVTPQRNRPVGPGPTGQDRSAPVVAFDEAAPAVHVTGYLAYGGGCDAPYLRAVEWREDGRLFVAVGHRRKWYLRLGVPVPVGCTGALGAIHYRVTVSVASDADLPATVEVVEDEVATDDTRRVVDRDEQAALCSRDPDSFESESRRAEAHWTCPPE